MNYIILILIGIAVVGLYIATRFLGKAFKIVTKIFLLLILVLIVLTLFVYKDMSSLKNGFIEQNNTFFLYEEGNLYTAVTLKPMANFNLTIDSFGYYGEEKLEAMEEHLNNKDYEALLKNNFRIFILHPDVMDRPYTLDLGAELDQNDLLDIIKSNEPFLKLSEKTYSTYQVSIEDLVTSYRESYKDEEKLKAYLFIGLLSSYFRVQDPGELAKNFKNRKLIIYPETISFKILRYLPWS